MSLANTKPGRNLGVDDLSSQYFHTTFTYGSHVTNAVNGLTVPGKTMSQGRIQVFCQEGAHWDGLVWDRGLGPRGWVVSNTLKRRVLFLQHFKIFITILRLNGVHWCLSYPGRRRRGFFSPRGGHGPQRSHRPAPVP